MPLPPLESSINSWFSEVAHSQEAIVPSDKLSDNFDLLWGTVKEDKNTNQIIKYINSPIPTP